MLTKPQEDNSMVLQGEAQYETDIGSKEGICNKGWTVIMMNSEAIHLRKACEHFDVKRC